MARYWLPVTAWLITDYGWQTAVIILAFVALILGWAISFILKPHGPERYGLSMDGKVIEPTKNITSSQIVQGNEKDIGELQSGLSLREAIRTRAFWLLVIVFTCTHTAVSAIVVREIPLVEDMGISKVVAATALGTMTLLSAPGRLLGGWFADKWNVKYLFFMSCIIQSIGLFILSRVTSMSWVWAFVVAYGLSYGMRIPLEPVLRAKCFGRKAFGSIMGYMNAFVMFGSFVGPYFAGWIFDTTGSYVTAFLVFAAMMVVAAVVVFFVNFPLEQPQKNLNTMILT